MTIINSREDILKHETPEYIASRPMWTLGKGRIPALSDYRKLSVDNMEEAMTLAKIGQIIGQQFIPSVQEKPFKTYFTQALILGASLITRSMAEKYHLDFEKYRSVLLVCPSRYGKGFGHSVKIMTKDGWKKHGELQVGDYVFHPDGHLVKVVAKSEPFKCVYRITFQNGSTFETSAEHEWYVWNKRKSNGRGNPQGGYELLETQAMEGKVLYNDPKGPRSRYFVEPPQPCQFDKKEQPLDPYFFGCWLGDGTSKYPWLTLNSQKAEHILPHIPYKVINSYPQIGCTRYVFSRQGIVGYLHSLKVFGDKHIPDCYKYSSPEQQKALLAGIIDTDGSVDRNGRVIVSCANERLAKDIMELLTIMGECPYETVVPATMSSSGVVGKHDVHMIGYQPAYDLPTKFKRLPRFIPHHRIGITKIEKVEHGEPGNCIQVDSPDGLYLVGEKLIPTHNSFINAASILIHAGANGEEVQIGAATMPKAQIIQAKAVEMLPWTNIKIQEGLIVDGDKEEDRFKKIKRLTTQVSKDNLRWTNGGSIAMFSTNETKKNAEVAAAGAIGIGGDFCIDGENKVLTRHGWVRLADLSDGEAVAQYTDDGKIEFVVPSRVIRKHYKGNGYIFTPPGTEDKIFMIPEHRQPLMNLDGEIVIREAKDLRLYNYWSVIMAGEGTGPNKLSAVDRLAIACQADGCILKTTEKGNYFQLKVKKERKARRLEVLFDEANMPVRIHQDKHGYYVCHFYMPITCNKHLPDWFGYEFGVDKARAILDEIVEWDGYIYPDGTLYYSSKIRENTEWVQAVATQAGYRSKVSVQHDSRKATFSDIHRIHIKKISTRSCDYAKMEETSWDDMVYCVTVPSGMFLIKNKKSTIITGNCVFDEVQLMTPVGFRTASRFMVESPDTKRFCVGNPMINGHFKELYDDPDTFVVHINEVTAIIEERMSRKGIRLTGMPTYSEQYRAFVETEFPDERSGTRFFTTLPEMWDPAKLPQPVRKFYFMGIDSAYKGGDSLMMSIVSFNEGGGKKWFALERQEDLKQRFGGKWEANTTLDISLDILKTWEKYNVTAGAIDIGFGIHIYEKLRDLDPEIPLEPINYASKPTEWRIEQDYNAKFALNKRAELHLDLRDLSSNDLLYIAPDYYDEVRREMGEVAQAPAKQKIQIEPKKDIKLRLGRSPDAMDSLCLGIHAAVLSGVLNGTNQLTDEDMMEIL